MKTLLVTLCFISLAKICSSQVTIHPACDTTLPLAKSVAVFIKAHRDEKQIDKDFFKNDFELAASDSSFKITFSRFSWNDSNIIMQRKNNGNVIRTDMPNYNKPDKETFSLRNIKPGAYLVFECIQVEKSGVVYRVSPFTIIVR